MIVLGPGLGAESTANDTALPTSSTQYNDELARKRMASEQEELRRRNAELVTMQVGGTAAQPAIPARCTSAPRPRCSTLTAGPRASPPRLHPPQEESSRRQEEEKARIAAQMEAERRATERYKAELEKSVQREKAIAEAEGRAMERRKNEVRGGAGGGAAARPRPGGRWGRARRGVVACACPRPSAHARSPPSQDIYRRELALKLEEDRKRLVEAINTAFGNLGSAAAGLLADRDKLLAAVGGLSLLALGVYSAREGTRVAGKAVDRWFGTPRLVRETSRRPLLGLGGGRARASPKSVEEVRRNFGDIVLAPELQDHVRALAAVTANTKRHGAPFRHMLFYGEAAACVNGWVGWGGGGDERVAWLRCEGQAGASVGLPLPWRAARQAACLAAARAPPWLPSRPGAHAAARAAARRPSRHRQDDGGQAPGAHQWARLRHPVGGRCRAAGRGRGHAAARHV